MKLINIAKRIIQENRKNKYCCTMLYFDFPLINEIHSLIDKTDLYIDEEDPSFGLETEPHTTLLFGTHEEVPEEDIINTANKFIYSKCLIYNASLFQNEKYDVLKFDVKGKNLHECNKALTQFPYTSNFPDYHPHMTIAYIKPGLGQKYVNLLKNKEWELVPKYGVYSKTDGNKTEFDIKVDQSK